MGPHLHQIDRGWAQGKKAAVAGLTRVRGVVLSEVGGWWRPCSMVASRAGANAATIVVAAAKSEFMAGREVR